MIRKSDYIFWGKSKGAASNNSRQLLQINYLIMHLESNRKIHVQSQTDQTLASLLKFSAIGA